MPLAVYIALQQDVDAAVAMSVLLLALSLGILLSIRLAPPWFGLLDRARARRP
jgi:ABC-type sulfate transport system permease component